MPQTKEINSTQKQTKKASKLIRPKTPTPMVLTERDKDILIRLWQDKMLKTSQIQRIFFPSPQVANTRLRCLWENSYVSRCFLPTLIFHGSSEAIYSLDKKGVDIVSAHLNIPRITILKGISYLKWKMRAKSFLLTLDHNLLIADFRIAFEKAAESHPQVEYEQWIPERMCQDEYQLQKLWEGRITGKFRPDGYGQYWYQERLFSLFVEIDLGTMSGQAFRNKVQRYLDYSLSGRYEQQFGSKFFRVLIATKGTQRLLNLKKVTEELTNTIFWFTTINQVSRENFFGKIWRRPGKHFLYSLLDKN